MNNIDVKFGGYHKEFAILTPENYEKLPAYMQEKGIKKLQIKDDSYGWNRDYMPSLKSFDFIDELLEHCHFIGAMRPDGSQVVDTTLELLGPKAKNRIHLMNVPEMKLSATYLRDRLRHGLTVRYMLPKCVVQYIEKYDIYRKE